MEVNLKRKFRIELMETWFGRHIGFFLCKENEERTGGRDRYIIIGLWKYDLYIGLITKEEKDNEI